MDAELVFKDEYPVSETAFVRMVAWRLPRQLPGSDHNFKYRFALVDGDTNVLRYDNEAGKGDHRHVGRRQFAYRFVDLEELRIDFWKDVEEWLRAKSGS